MKKLNILLGVALFLAFTSVPAYAQGKISVDGVKLPKVMGIATGGVGATGQVMAVSLASVMQDTFGIPVRTMPAHAPAINLRQMLSGNAQIQAGCFSQETYADAIMGKDIYANQDWGPQNIGFVWYMYAAPSALMVRGDSSIKRFEDLKGKKFSMYYAAPAYGYATRAYLAYANLTLDDVKLVEVGGYADCIKAVADGRADAGHAFGTSPVTYEAAQNPHGIRFLEMPFTDKEAWARYFSVCPYRDKMRGDLCVPEMKGLEVVSTPFFIWAYMGLDENLAYLIAKFIVEKYDSYKDQHPSFIYMSVDNMLEFMKTGLAVPVHPGTVRYLKEIGKWSDADELWNNRVRAGHAKRVQAWEAALDEALPKKVAVSYTNKAWLEIWNKHRAAIPDLIRRDME